MPMNRTSRNPLVKAVLLLCTKWRKANAVVREFSSRASTKQQRFPVVSRQVNCPSTPPPPFSAVTMLWDTTFRHHAVWIQQHNVLATNVYNLQANIDDLIYIHVFSKGIVVIAAVQIRADQRLHTIAPNGQKTNHFHWYRGLFLQQPLLTATWSSYASTPRKYILSRCDN